MDKELWGVNVQPYSGSIANLAVFNGLLKPNDKVMGLDLFSGGHLSHGFKTEKKNVNITSEFYTSLSYKVGDNGWIDYKQLEKDVLKFKPKLLICGGSNLPDGYRIC